MRGSPIPSATTRPPAGWSGESRATRWGRDIGPYSARNTSKGALLAEVHAVFRLLGAGASIAEVQAACLSGRILRQRARETRRQIWNALHHRYFAWNPPRWVLADLAEAARGEVTDTRFVGLAYIHYARRDRLTFEFVTDGLAASWRARNVQVRRDDVLDFLAEREGRETQVKRWRETTRKKLAGNILSALRDFGVLDGVRRKKIRRPGVPPDVALHLWRLLYGEGLRGRAIVEAPDWRLFLWEVEDVRFALGGLHLPEDPVGEGR
ncbi:MAG TPA: BrxA family protein [Bryobacteraceae bacterium]|nr:BrxA family protein [Bryobacteraceae bacterium]